MPTYRVRRTIEMWIDIAARNQAEAIRKAKTADESEWFGFKGDLEIDEDESPLTEAPSPCPERDGQPCHHTAGHHGPHRYTRRSLSFRDEETP